MRTTDMDKINVKRRFHVYNLDNSVSHAAYYTDCFEDILPEHQALCCLLDAANHGIPNEKVDIPQSGQVRQSHHIELPGVGYADYYFNSPPNYSLHFSRIAIDK
jgi:hypothetical protein